MIAGRRDVLALGGVGLLALACVSQGAVASEGQRLRQTNALAVVRSFYLAHNHLQWGTLQSLMADEIVGRSNAGWFVPDESTRNSQMVAGGIRIGGVMSGSDAVVDFLRERQQRQGWRWTIDSYGSQIAAGSDGWVVSLTEPIPDHVSPDAGPLQLAQPKFAHVFWCKIEGSQEAVTSCKIADFYEIDLMEVGR